MGHVSNLTDQLSEGLGVDRINQQMGYVSAIKSRKFHEGQPPLIVLDEPQTLMGRILN